jgi:hypothetical protein
MSALIPGLAEKLERCIGAAGDSRQGITAWQRSYGLGDCQWIADSVETSLNFWTPGYRRFTYVSVCSGGDAATYKFAVELPYLRTADPESFRECLHRLLDEDLDSFIASEHPEYSPVPAPAGDMAAGLDGLVMRVCLRMPIAAVLERLYPGQAKDYSAVQRAMRRAARIIGDIKIPSSGRPKLGK